MFPWIIYFFIFFFLFIFLSHGFLEKFQVVRERRRGESREERKGGQERGGRVRNEMRREEQKKDKSKKQEGWLRRGRKCQMRGIATLLFAAVVRGQYTDVWGQDPQGRLKDLDKPRVDSDFAEVVVPSLREEIIVGNPFRDSDEVYTSRAEVLSEDFGSVVSPWLDFGYSGDYTPGSLSGSAPIALLGFESPPSREMVDLREQLELDLQELGRVHGEAAEAYHEVQTELSQQDSISEIQQQFEQDKSNLALWKSQDIERTKQDAKGNITAIQQEVWELDKEVAKKMEELAKVRKQRDAKLAELGKTEEQMHLDLSDIENTYSTLAASMVNSYNEIMALVQSAQTRLQSELLRWGTQMSQASSDIEERQKRYDADLAALQQEEHIATITMIEKQLDALADDQDALNLQIQRVRSSAQQQLTHLTAAFQQRQNELQQKQIKAQIGFANEGSNMVVFREVNEQINNLFQENERNVEQVSQHLAEEEELYSLLSQQVKNEEKTLKDRLTSIKKMTGLQGSLQNSELVNRSGAHIYGPEEARARRSESRRRRRPRSRVN